MFPIWAPRNSLDRLAVLYREIHIILLEQKRNSVTITTQYYNKIKHLYTSSSHHRDIILLYYTYYTAERCKSSLRYIIMRYDISLTTMSHFLVTSILLYCHTSRQPVAVVSGLWKMDSSCEKTNPGKLGPGKVFINSHTCMIHITHRIRVCRYI